MSLVENTGAENMPNDERRFAFGKNWARFLELLNDERIAEAEKSLKTMLGVESLAGKRFLDIGSGSGLFSLAARNLGATVYSFDYDLDSVGCTQELKRRYWPDDAHWHVERGDVLDEVYLQKLGAFDVVYSWGVLHHTGAMWQALAHAASLVADNGHLFIAIYNDQGRPSRTWAQVKKAYNALPGTAKWLVLAPAFVRLWGPTTIRDLLVGRPFSTWRSIIHDRGMSPWRDVVDWVGGWPFEVATPEQIFDFYKQRHFALENLKTCAGGLGCNEFVFSKQERA